MKIIDWYLHERAIKQIRILSGNTILQSARCHSIAMIVRGIRIYTTRISTIRISGQKKSGAKRNPKLPIKGYSYALLYMNRNNGCALTTQGSFAPYQRQESF